MKQPPQSRIVPYRCKCMTRREAELRNRLFSRDHGLTMQMGRNHYTVRLEPGDSGAPLKAPMAAHVSLDERLWFEVRPQEALLSMMLTEIATVEDFKSLSEEVRGVAMEASLESVLDSVDQVCSFHSTIHRVSVNPAQAQTQASLVFSLAGMSDGSVGKADLRTDAAGLEWIAQSLASKPGGALRRLDRLPVCGHVEIGSATLSVAEIKNLACCDIILSAEPASRKERGVRICFSRKLALAGNMMGTDLILIQQLMMKEKMEAAKVTDEKKTAGGPTDASIADIPVQLIFEVGRTEISLGELRRIQPGYTLKLKDPPDERMPVRIMANGVAVGKGEIVYIEDLLGIRVLEFNESDREAAIG